jgi:3-oxoacyl-[acyl-carrier-protein] synthase-1
MPEMELHRVVCAQVALEPSADNRIMQLALLCMKDLLGSSGLKRSDMGKTGFFVSLPPPTRKGSAGAAIEDFKKDFFLRLGITSAATFQVSESGHAGALIGLDVAVKSLHYGECSFAVVLGTDSLIDGQALFEYDEAYRLKTPTNSDGFVPGEGAAAFLLETAVSAQSNNRKVMAIFEGAGIGQESCVIGSDTPCVGEGMMGAIRTLFSDAQPKAGSWMLCDFNGESYRSREWGYCVARCNEQLKNVSFIWHPADCIGDTGAASGSILTVLAARAFERGYAPDQQCLLWTSSDCGDRAIALLCAASAVESKSQELPFRKERL